MKLNSIGILGYGSLGQLLHKYIPSSLPTVIVDVDTSAKISDLGSCDVIFLSIPVQSYKSVLPELAKHIKQTALIVDVCSVKIVPTKLIETHFPNHSNTLLSHPLFGPESAKDNLQGQQLVVCDEKGSAAQFTDLLQSMFGLDIVRMSADDHDKHMADMHAITFYLAKGLDMYGTNYKQIHTPSYDWLIGLAELDKHHSAALLETIQVYNPYAKEARRKLLGLLEELETGYSGA